MVTAATESLCQTNRLQPYLDGCMLMLWCCHKYCASNLSSMNGPHNGAREASRICTEHSVCDKWKWHRNKGFLRITFSRLSSFLNVFAPEWFPFFGALVFHDCFHFYCWQIHSLTDAFVGRHRRRTRTKTGNEWNCWTLKGELSFRRTWAFLTDITCIIRPTEYDICCYSQTLKPLPQRQIAPSLKNNQNRWATWTPSIILHTLSANRSDSHTTCNFISLSDI